MTSRERLNSVNGAWRPFVGIFMSATLAFGATGTWKLFDLQQEFYRGQEAQNARLSVIEEGRRTQDQFIDLAAMLASLTRTELEIAGLKAQIETLTRELRALTPRLRRPDRPE